jgi:hypothetical protein
VRPHSQIIIGILDDALHRVPVKARVDAWLAGRGSLAEPEWHWTGE